MYSDITQKAAAVLTLLHLFFTTAAQEWQMERVLPHSGQAQVLAAASDGNYLCIGFAFNETISFDALSPVAPYGRQDLVIWINVREEAREMVKHIGNADEALLSDMVLDGDSETLYLQGSFWDSLILDNGLIYRLQSGSKGIFMAALDLKNGVWKWVHILDGQSSKTAGGVCFYPGLGIRFSGFFASGQLEDESGQVLTTAMSAAYLYAMDESGNLLWSAKVAEGMDVRASKCVLDEEQLIMGGQFRGQVDFSGQIEEGRILDFDIFLLSLGAEDDSFRWLTLGRGVLDKSIKSLSSSEPGIYVLAGDISGNMTFQNGFSIRSRGSLADAYMLFFDGGGTPVRARVWSGSGTFSGQYLSRDEGSWFFSGTYDGSMDVGNTSLFSPTGRRSGIIVKHNPDQDPDIAISALVEGLASFTAQLDPNAFILNFRGKVQFENLELDVGSEFKTLVAQRTTQGIISPRFTPESFAIFPNPFSDVIHFPEEIEVLEVLSLEGKRIEISSSGRASVFTNHWPAGNYFFRASDTSGNIRFAKGVKLR